MTSKDARRVFRSAFTVSGGSFTTTPSPLVNAKTFFRTVKFVELNFCPTATPGSFWSIETRTGETSLCISANDLPSREHLLHLLHPASAGVFLFGCGIPAGRLIEEQWIDAPKSGIARFVCWRSWLTDRGLPFRKLS